MARMLAALARLLILPGLVALLAPEAVGTPSAQDEVPSVAGRLAAIDEALGKGRYEQASDALQELMREHAQDREAWLVRPRILERLAEAAQGDALEPPSATELILGDVRRYSERTGTLEVVHDWTDLRRMGEPTSIDRFRYGRDETEFLVYPAPFAGTFSVEVKLRRLPARRSSSFNIVVIMPDNNRLDVRVSSVDIVLSHFRGSWKSLDTHSLKDENGGPVRLKLVVENASASVSLDGKRILKGKKPTGLFGHFALGPYQLAREVVVEGRAERSWVRGLEDAHVAAQRASFRADYDPPIPDVFGAHEPSGVPDPRRDPLPVELDPESVRVIRDSIVGSSGSSLGSEARKQVLDELEDVLAGISGPAAVKHWVAAWQYYYLRHWKGARQHGDALLALEPDFVPGRKLRALIAGESGEQALARNLLSLVVEAHPEQTWAGSRLAELALEGGDHEAARDLVRAALDRGHYDTTLARVHASVLKAEDGPLWREVYEVSSKHYVVRTDLDLKTAREALSLLTSARDHYSTLLELDVPTGLPPAHVYLFSGRASYLDYIDGVTGVRPESTAGLYSPTLDQLLVWNLPEREEMFATIRHEGFHQYAHHALPELPMWLNEGIAELFEGADFTRGRRGRYGARVGHMAILRPLFQTGFLRLNVNGGLYQALTRVLAADRALFYGSAREVNYALAWLLVHHLTNTTQQNRELLKDLVWRLDAGESGKEATRAVFTQDARNELIDGLDETYAELLKQLTRR